MIDLKILDVTLRDGGYKNNFHFAPNIVEKVVKNLDQSGIDYIEVGYRNGSFKESQDIGLTGLCPREYLELCRSFIKNSKLTVMFHPKNIRLNEIGELKQCGVDTVRICFSFQDKQGSFKYIEDAKERGLEVCVNITRISQHAPENILKVCREIEEHGADVIYLADSNGSLTPKKVRFLFTYLMQECRVKFGFHAHDNLFLAQANAISAIENGASFIDSSILGLGKGAGNLKTEGFISFLLSQKIKKYNLCKIFEIANYLSACFGINSECLSIRDIILGIFDLSQDDASNLGELITTADFYERAKRYSFNLRSLETSNA